MIVCENRVRAQRQLDMVRSIGAAMDTNGKAIGRLMLDAGVPGRVAREVVQRVRSSRYRGHHGH